MKKAIVALSICMALCLSACDNNANTSTQESNANSQANASQEQTAAQAYLALVDRFFNDKLALEPLYATYVGVDDYNDQFGDGLSDQYLKQRHQLNTRYLKEVDELDRDHLPADLRLSYDMFTYDRNVALADETFPNHFMPMNQFYSTVISMAQLGSGESAQPFKTVQDYRNWEQRLLGFIAWMKQAQMRMNEGIESNVVLPRVLVDRIIPQLTAQLVAKPEDSLFYAPIRTMPDHFSTEDKMALTAEYKALIAEKLIPEMTALRDYFQNTYVKSARASDGWWGLPNGKMWYQHLANTHTTTTMPVDEIHKIGLEEVARILSEMDKVRQQVGFKGDLTAFSPHFLLSHSISLMIARG